MSIDQPIARYVEIGIAQDDALFHDRYAEFNRLFDRMRDIEKELAARRVAVRRALMVLYKHENLQVWLNVAKRTLAAAPAEARRVIQAIADTELYPQAGDGGYACGRSTKAFSSRSSQVSS